MKSKLGKKGEGVGVRSPVEGRLVGGAYAAMLSCVGDVAIKRFFKMPSIAVLLVSS